MWLEQIPLNGSPTKINSKATHEFITPLKPRLVGNHSELLPTLQNKGHYFQKMDAFPKVASSADVVAASITFINIHSNNNGQDSKFQLKVQSQTQKISAITRLSQNIKRREGDVDWSSSEQDFDSDDDDNVLSRTVSMDNSEDDGLIPCRFDFLPRLFINCGYVICLIPFRLVPVTIGNKVVYEIRHHSLQRIISMIQCTTASIVCFLVAYSHIRNKNIEKNPLVIFKFWSYAVFTCWCFQFTNLFWRKPHLILALVNKEPPNLDKKVEARKYPPFHQNLDEIFATTFFFGIVLEEIFHKSVFYLFPKVYNWQRAAEVYSGKAMYSMFVVNSSKPIPWKDISPVTLGVSIWHFVGWESFGAIKSLFYIFVTFCSLFLIGRIKREFRAVKKLSTLSNVHGGISKHIWSHFVEVRSTVAQINELTDLCVLGIYLILVPFLSSSFIQRWDSDFIEYKILMVLQFVWPTIALVCATEATRFSEKFLHAVKEGSEDANRSRIHSGGEITHCPAYFVYENANLSLKGGKFFSVTYGFMGATLSVVMTYGLVILSFLHDTYIGKGKC